jgi:hypothetical protein
MVARRPPARTTRLCHERLEERPFLVAQQTTDHHRSPTGRPASNHIAPRRGNPLYAVCPRSLTTAARSMQSTAISWSCCQACRCGTVTHDYKRHGTMTLFTGMSAWQLPVAHRDIVPRRCAQPIGRQLGLRPTVPNMPTQSRIIRRTTGRSIAKSGKPTSGPTVPSTGTNWRSTSVRTGSTGLLQNADHRALATWDPSPRHTAAGTGCDRPATFLACATEATAPVVFVSKSRVTSSSSAAGVNA